MHVFGRCDVWKALRASFLETAGVAETVPERVAVAVLTACPNQPAFAEAVAFCAEVAAAATVFWHSAHENS